jgi:hypothetical protein
MFDGRDYHQAFEEACDQLTGRVLDRNEVLGQLVGIEWTLWEAVRGAMIVVSNIITLIAIAPIAYVAWPTGNSSWIVGMIFVVLWGAVAFGIYWIFRLTAYYEIARHVKGRRFGDIDLPWLPSGTSHNSVKYPIES